MAVIVSFVGKWDNKDVVRAQKEIAKFADDSGGKVGGFAKKAGAAFSSVGAAAVGLGAAFGVGFAGVQSLVNVFQDSIAEAQEAIKVNAATAQIIKSTGSAAKVTSDQVADLSQRLSEQIAVDDELIQSSANLILTFKQIRNEGEGLNAIFDRTVLAAQDLAAAGFGDAESAAKMLGKALNDPERGLTALGRAGVTFTAQQKEQIKTLVQGGDVLSAQKVILAEVESQVGGVAAATATGIDKFNVYFANLKEELGLAILPFINALIEGVLPGIKAVSGALANSSKFFTENKNAIIVTTAAVVALTAAMLANRIGGIAFAAQYAAHTVATGAYTLAAKAATVATGLLSAAMKAVPFVALVTVATGLVVKFMDINEEAQGATRAMLDNARATNRLRDAQGELTDVGRAYYASQRFTVKGHQAERDAISGTVSAAVAYGSAMKNQIIPNTYDAAEAADDAAYSYMKLWESIINAENAERWREQMNQTSGTVSSAIAAGVRLGSSPVWQQIAKNYGEVEKSAKGAGGAVKNTRDEFEKTFNERAKEAISGVLDTLKGKLDEANAKFREFAGSIASGLFGQLNITSAVDQAGETGGSIVGAFVDQAQGIQAFGDQLQQLLQTNLSEEAFALVASLSAEKGSLLAKELLGANSETLIANFNQAVEATKTVADLVGQNAATKWYQQGVDSAQRTYEGFRDNFKKGGPGYQALQNLMDRLAESMKRDTTITVTTINRTINEVVTNTQFGGPRANGGPVLSNTAYLVGERGPELFVPDVSGTIIPNGGVAGSVGIAGSSINLTVNAGMGTDGAEVGRQVVEALKQYERRNGAIPVKVAS